MMPKEDLMVNYLKTLIAIFKHFLLVRQRTTGHVGVKLLEHHQPMFKVNQNKSNSLISAYFILSVMKINSMTGISSIINSTYDLPNMIMGQIPVPNYYLLLNP